MKEVERFIENMLKVPLSKMIIAFLVIIFSYLINRIIISNIFKLMTRLVKKTDNHLDDNFIKAMENPLKFLILFYGIYLSFKIIDLDGFNIIAISTSKVMRIGIIITVFYFAYNLTLENSVLYSKLHKNNTGNTILFPFISILIRLIIVIIGISIIANEFGFTGFIAGLGISGVAFALAAQDTFSNLFGGIVIVLDKPFAIGDWIQSSEVEGIVEEITFRSTKIRTFSMSLATVPNSKLANSNIINWTQRELRRIHFKFTIEHTTSIESVESVINKIENMLKSHPKIDKKMIIVSFNELSTYGFTIFIYFYTNEFDYVSYEKLKQDINLKILLILKEESIKLICLTFNFNNLKQQEEGYCESQRTELESIQNITEEERGI